MNSELKYFHMEDRDKLIIPVLIMKGKSLRYISNRFGLTQKFLKNKFALYIYRSGSEVTIQGKQEPYYDDEMMYGKTDLKYDWSQLNLDEKLTWYKYEKKQI